MECALLIHNDRQGKEGHQREPKIAKTKCKMREMRGYQESISLRGWLS